MWYGGLILGKEKLSEPTYLSNKTADILGVLRTIILGNNIRYISI